MKMRVGILTSGGDCPGLNATIRGVAMMGFGAVVAVGFTLLYIVGGENFLSLLTSDKQP